MSICRVSLGCIAGKRGPRCRLETPLVLLSSFIISSETLCEPISFLVPEITSRFFIIPFGFNLSLTHTLSLSLSLSLSLPTSVSISLAVSLSPLSVSLSFFSLSLSFPLSIRLSLCLFSLCLSLCLSLLHQIQCSFKIKAFFFMPRRDLQNKDQRRGTINPFVFVNCICIWSGKLSCNGLC